MLADLYARKSGATRPATARTIGAKADPVAKPTEPSPTNRADAIEITVEEDTPAAPAAPPPQSPTSRADAIEVPIEVEAADQPKPPPAALNASDGIEIELGAQPVSGEIEVPIVGTELDPPPAASLPKPGELPAELELGLDPPPPPPSYELDVPAAPPSYELDVESPSEPLEAVELEQVQQPPPPPAPEPIVELEQVVEEAPAPPPAVVAPPPAVVAPPPAVVAPPSAVVAPPPSAALDPLPEDDVVVLTKKREPAPFTSSASKSEAPPGLKLRRPDAPAASPPTPQSSPSGARIWLPPAFQAPVAAAPPPPTASATPSTPVAEPTSAQTELERSLEVFAQFDVDAPKAATPKPAAAPPAAATPAPARQAPTVASFTELELEGDSLLQAVEAAAAIGADVPRSSPSVQINVEEVMEAPDDLKPDPGSLPKIPLFSDLPEDAFIALFERCPLRRAEPGDRIIEQGSQGTSFFVICAGKVRVLRTDGDATRELATLDEGAFFGEMALLSDAPRSASVEAASEDTQLLEIPAIVLTDLSTQYPTVATALKKFCRQRLLANLMNSAALFKPFTKSERRDLVQRFRARDAVPGEVLIREGQPSDGLYVVLTGEVSVAVGGRQVATLKEGQVFGEMSLLTRSPTSATVKTTRRTSFLRLPREDFDQLIMSHPQILEQVAELTDERRKQNAALQVRPDATASMV
ncbi:MAG: cyclic nucleotide-binding domain-containing protein [Archangium sp.]|nr:cyclic nucleotide-binding domain-containing protein [Archangium sp.]